MPHAQLLEIDGVVYRSRMEGRWAYLMHTLGIPFEHEPASFPVPGGLYVPDFWLPTGGRYLEVKPQAPKPEELHKAKGLMDLTGSRLFVLCGFPRLYGGDVTNLMTYWGDGSPVGPGMPTLVTLLYVLGLLETEDMRGNLVRAISHTRAATPLMGRDLIPIRDLLLSLRLTWPERYGEENERG